MSDKGARFDDVEWLTEVIISSHSYLLPIILSHEPDVDLLSEAVRHVLEYNSENLSSFIERRDNTETSLEMLLKYFEENKPDEFEANITLNFNVDTVNIYPSYLIEFLSSFADIKT